MPRYGYGYAQSPDDMATGNPFYNPNRPGPDWAAGVAAFYQNLQQAKDRKRAQQQQDEELRWQRYAQEQAMKENAWKEQDRIIKEQERAQKEAEARGERIRKKMADFEETVPLPKMRAKQVADYHKYDLNEFMSLPAKRQKDLEDEMTTGKRDVEGRKISAGGREGAPRQWEDEATQLGGLLKSKLGELDDQIARYKTLSEKAEEEYRTASMGKSETMRARAQALRKAADTAKRYAGMLELHQKTLRSYQTSLKPGTSVDQVVKRAVTSDYPKTISDIIGGGQDVEMDVSGGGQNKGTPPPFAGQFDGQTATDPKTGSEWTWSAASKQWK